MKNRQVYRRRESQTDLRDIALGYRLDDQEFESRQGLAISLFTTGSKPALGPTESPIQWVQGALSLGVKRLGREADHLPPSSAEVTSAWSYNSTPQYAFMAWCSVKGQGWMDGWMDGWRVGWMDRWMDGWIDR
jgi:hypothetical protein